MSGNKFSLISLLALAILFSLTAFSINAFADGFSEKHIRFDGKLTKGKLDDNENLGFSGRGRWGTPVTVRFSPIVRAQFSLVPFIETEASGILGAYTITFTLDAKTRNVSYKNLRISILDRTGKEIESSGMISQSGKGWVIGIATEQEPSDVHISYSTVKGSVLTPVVSDDREDL